MQESFITIQDFKIKVISLNTAIIGSGAAGLNAAVRLFDFGQTDIAIITEGLKEELLEILALTSKHITN